MSNDLQASKSGLKTGYHGTNGQTSQIPGLSSGASSGPEEKTRGRRVGVLESDSAYVKLAKQGGQKDLLCHEDILCPKSTSYKAPDWFCPTAADGDGKSGLIKNEEKRSPGAFPVLEPPFGTDRTSALEQGDSGDGKQEQDNVPCSQMEELSLSPQHDETSGFMNLPTNKKGAPVNMSKLLSFGYAEGEKTAPSSDESND
ncbi:uncharacterized protein C7orf57-like isoform 2-T2 [Polymixia lowei]